MEAVGSRAGRSPRPFWQEPLDGVLLREWAGRKVRPPPRRVPDNIRDAGAKPARRTPPHKTHRPVGVVGAIPEECRIGARVKTTSSAARAQSDGGVRVKRCGKSVPPDQ